MGRAALFDRIVVVDWSAASAPRRGADSIWIAALDADGCRLENPPTRRAASDRLMAIVDDVSVGCTLLGVDFSLGYPAGTAVAAGLGRGGLAWRAMWEHLEACITDGDDNTNNRFAVGADLNRRIGEPLGPFWGRPARMSIEGLPTRKPATTRPQWRGVEAQLRAHGWRPFSSWQLLGAGSVGSQSLTGIPILQRMRRRAGSRVHVWPFTTGLRPPVLRAGDVVIAEVWPTLVPHDGAHAVRDAAQVLSVADHLARLDEAGELAALFQPEVDDDMARPVVDEEGWVLGVSRAGVG
ncbi:MAG: cobalamin biosynthesis protein CbiG [Ilumatobacteraceae bacterium]